MSLETPENATLAETAIFRYDKRTVLLHWITAFFVVFLWGSAQIIDLFPAGYARINMRGMHIAAGVLLAAVLVHRVTWRYSKGSRRVVQEVGWVARSSKFVHFVLYALLIAQVILGFGNVWVRGDSIFNLFSIPVYPDPTRAMRNLTADLHRWVANALLAVAGAHTVAALIHHFIRRDDVLSRMLPTWNRQ